MSVFLKPGVNAKSKQIMRHYKRDERGNFGVMAALCLTVFVGCLAIAIDLANAFSAKSRLQDTTDAVALMAAKDFSKTQAELDIVAQNYFTMTYPGADGSRIKIKELKRDNDAVTVTVENNVDAYFSRIFGKENLDVAAQSSAIYAQKAMDVALVLDTTYSMNGSKLASLKTASTNLVETIEKQKNDNVRLSVIPFVQYVNVGTSRRNAVWLDVPADKTVVGENVCRIKRDVISRSNCRTIHRTCTDDGVKRDCSYKKCDVKRGAPYESCYTTPTKKIVWNGCVGSRNTPYDVDPAYNGRKIPGLLDIKCGTEIQPLTTDLKSVKKTLNNLNASNLKFETYMPAGLAWGWRALDNREPLTEVGKPKSGINKSEKVLVLMTDGFNTTSKSGIFHKEDKDTKNTNLKTKTLCSAIKSSEITVYTIAYEVSDKDTKSLLQGCASDNSKYFDAKNASELNKAFEAIGEALNELRITA